jgi:hypothetical protein
MQMNVATGFLNSHLDAQRGVATPLECLYRFYANR